MARDDDAMARVRESLTAARDRRAAGRKRELAATLADLRAPTEALVHDALEVDVALAVARFAADFDCVLAERGGRGFRIEGGRNPLLDVAFAETEPVEYGVDGVALLSGVNSGGKRARSIWWRWWWCLRTWGCRFRPRRRACRRSRSCITTRSPRARLMRGRSRRRCGISRA